MGEVPARRSAARYLPGCLLFVPGFFGGGMMAVLVGKVVAGLRRAPACADVPLCNWEQWVLVGGVAGGLVLSIMVLWRIRASDRAAGGADFSERG
jgi:hypothetical protein